MGETAVATAEKAVEEFNELQTVWSAKDLIMAGLAYTVMGMVIVFAVLVIIMMVIKAMALFSVKKKPVHKQNSLAENNAQEEVAPVAVEIEEETDDRELIAVITAAIAASMDQSASGFVVRSYKRISDGVWNKAGRLDVLDNRF